MRTRLAAAALLGGLGLLAVVLAGCGGGSSSNTGPSSFSGGGGGGGSSGAVVQGQIRTRTAAVGESAVVVVLQKALGIGIAEALPGDPVPDGTLVTLTPTGGGAVLQTQTTAGGAFTFTNVLPGEYTITVQGLTVENAPVTVLVGAGDLANVTGTVLEGTIALNVVVTANPPVVVENVLQNDAQVGHLINLALAAGVPADQVLALRLQGKGWGDIAHILGVDPSNIGLGHGPSQADIDAFKASHGKGNGKGKKKGQG